MNSARVTTGARTAAVSLLAVVLAACGSAQTPSGHSGAAPTSDLGSAATSPSTTVTPEAAAHANVVTACRDWVAIDDAVKHGPGQQDGPQPSPAEVRQFATSLVGLVHRFVAVAPATPRAAAARLAAGVDTAARSGNPADMDSTHNPDQNRQLDAVETWVRRACGFQNLTVMGADYRFDGLPANVRSGPTSIAFMNHSGHDETHEIVLLRIKHGAGFTPATLVRALKADPRGAEQRYGNEVESVTGAQAPAGQLTYVTTTLRPGHYIAACFIGDPPHVTKGDDHCIRGAVTPSRHGPAPMPGPCRISRRFPGATGASWSCTVGPR